MKTELPLSYQDQSTQQKGRPWIPYMAQFFFFYYKRSPNRKPFFKKKEKEIELQVH